MTRYDQMTWCIGCRRVRPGPLAPHRGKLLCRDCLRRARDEETRNRTRGGDRRAERYGMRVLDDATRAAFEKNLTET